MKKSEINEKFDKIIKDETESYDLREYLEDTCKYGQTAFTYYDDTSEIYDSYRSDCEVWLEDLLSEGGLYPWEFFGGWEIFPDSEENKWRVVVAMFEDHCRYLLDDLDQ